MTKMITAETTMDDLMADPASYGVPTFHQFSKNPAAYRKRSDSSMVALDRGPQQFRKDLNKVFYKCHGVSLSSQEEAERVILDHGYTLEDLELGRKGSESKLKYNMRMIPQGAGKYDVEVDLLP